MLTTPDATASTDTDALTGAAAGVLNKAVDKGLGTDYAVLIVLPIVFTAMWVVLWRWGGFKEHSANQVKVAEFGSQALADARVIAEIHERVINKSPAAYGEVLMSRRTSPAPPPDRSPSLRVATDQP